MTIDAGELHNSDKSPGREWATIFDACVLSASISTFIQLPKQLSASCPPIVCVQQLIDCDKVCSTCIYTDNSMKTWGKTSSTLMKLSSMLDCLTQQRFVS